MSQRCGSVGVELSEEAGGVVRALNEEPATAPVVRLLAELRAAASQDTVVPFSLVLSRLDAFLGSWSPVRIHVVPRLSLNEILTTASLENSRSLFASCSSNG